MNSRGGKDVAGASERDVSATRRLIGGGLRLYGALLAVCGAIVYGWGETARWFTPDMRGTAADLLALGEIAAQLRVPFGQVLAVCAVPLLLFPRRASAVAVWVVVGLCLGPAAWLELAPRPGGERALRVLSANVLWTNPLDGEILDAIAAEDADVIGIVEVSASLRAAALERFGETHPHLAEGTDRGGWRRAAVGQLILSRFPIRRSEVIREGIAGSRRPVVEAEIEAPGGVITFQLVHTERPGRAPRLAQRSGQLDALAARSIEGTRVVMGDLNTASSSPIFRRFVARTGLVDTRVGFGRLPTWRQFPEQVPPAVASALKARWRPSVAIDHVLVTPDLVAVDRRTFRVIGSDHRGVVADLRLRP